MASVTLTDNKNPCSHQPNIHDVVSTNMDGYLLCGGGGCTNIVTGQQLCATCLDNPPDDVEEECQCKQMPSDAESQLCRSCLRDHGDVFLGRKRQRPTNCAKAVPPPAKCAKADETTYLAVPFTHDGSRDRFYMFAIHPQKSLKAPVYSSQSESDGESGAESDDGGTIDRRPLRIEDFPEYFPEDFPDDRHAPNVGAGPRANTNTRGEGRREKADDRVVRTFRWSKENEKSCTVDEFHKNFVSFKDRDLNPDTKLDIVTAAEKICEQKANEKLAWIVEEILHRNSSSIPLDDILTQVDQHYLPCFRRYFPFDKDSVQSVLNKLVHDCKAQSVKSEYSPKRPRKSRILPTVKRVLRTLDSLLHGKVDACLCRQRVV